MIKRIAILSYQMSNLLSTMSESMNKLEPRSYMLSDRNNYTPMSDLLDNTIETTVKSIERISKNV